MNFEFAKETIFFLTDRVHKTGNSQPLADWAGLDDWAMTRRATIASTSDQGRQIRKFNGENVRFRSLGIKLSFGR